MKKKKILAVFGTRPEAVKMCPLVRELRQRTEAECLVCLTGQHRELLEQVMETFELRADYHLAVMREGQGLPELTAAVLEGMDPVLRECAPELVLVHGDTTTSFAAALAAFYRKIPVGHVEAGLRTGDRYAPYPEEMNRQLTARIAKYHFAPTERNRWNLQLEGICDGVYVTGNTGIDALRYTVSPSYRFREPRLRTIDWGQRQKIILLTAHRRENWGEGLEQVFHAVRRIAKLRPDVLIIYPVHPNPVVKRSAEQVLGELPNVWLTAPLELTDMHNLMARCYFVLTDSGGVQEEAPALGKPVLVLRGQTERPEGEEAGTTQVVGIKEEDVFQSVTELLTSPEKYGRMAHTANPFGDGRASQRIADLLLHGIETEERQA